MGKLDFDLDDLFVVCIPEFQVDVDLHAINDGQLNFRDPFPEFICATTIGRSVLKHVVFVENPLDFINEPSSLCDEELTKIGQLADLGVDGIGRKNPTDTIRPLSTLKSFSVVPKELSERVGITLIGFFVRRMVGLDHDDF